MDQEYRRQVCLGCRQQLKSVFRDPSFRESFRADLRNPKPGTVFQGNWERVIVAAPVKPENAGLADRNAEPDQILRLWQVPGVP